MIGKTKNKKTKKKHREMFLIKEMQNCVFSSLNMQFFLRSRLPRRHGYFNKLLIAISAWASRCADIKVLCW